MNTNLINNNNNIITSYKFTNKCIKSLQDCRNEDSLSIRILIYYYIDKFKVMVTATKLIAVK